MSARAPIVAVIAGPNGAGKSTLAPMVLKDTLRVFHFVNVDQLALGLSGFAPEDAAITAGRHALARMRDHARHRRDFAFETTLASRTFAPWLAELRSTGYATLLAFLWLPTPEMAIERVRMRVRQGGHDIPEPTIRRRHTRGLENFFHLYRSVCGAWRFYDSAGERPRLVAAGEGKLETSVADPALWNRLRADHGA